MTPVIRTVLGDIAPPHLGVTDAHDHLFLRTPALPGQELDDVAAALDELTGFAALGGGAVVQWTPWGLGRHLDRLPELSRRSGVHVVAATGLHQARHYDPATLRRAREGLAERFVRELTEGSVRAGLVKVAGAYHHLDGHAREVLAAAAQAHHATDAPIGVHLEAGTAALDVLDLLCGAHGVPAHRVILGHLQRFPDRAVHRHAAESGAFLAYDGPSRAHHATDAHLMAGIADLVEHGHGGQILLGGDTVTPAARSTADGPGMVHLLCGLRPRLARELGADVAAAVFVDNPARAFAARFS
jgi:phosphotriesterase-related protein